MTYAELYLWFDVEKIAKTPCRGIVEAFEEVAGDDAPEVRITEGRGGINLVVERRRAGDGIKVLSELAE